MTNLLPPAPKENNDWLFLAGVATAVSGLVMAVLSGKIDVNVTLSQKDKSDA